MTMYTDDQLLNIAVAVAHSPRWAFHLHFNPDWDHHSSPLLPSTDQVVDLPSTGVHKATSFLSELISACVAYWGQAGLKGFFEVLWRFGVKVESRLRWYLRPSKVTV